MVNSLTIEPLLTRGGFNWVFLVDILVCAVLALFFLFYFNRLFATVLAYCIRAWTWYKYRAYIDISSLQISVLGGRIFFKRIRYQAHNVTVLVYHGHITWRYWLRHVQDAEVFLDEASTGRQKGRDRSTSAVKSEDDGKSSGEEKEKPRSRSIGKEEKAGGKPKKELPCRISVKVSGVEAFIYNRSPVYDIVKEQTLHHAQPRPGTGQSDDSAAREANSGSSSDSNEKKKHDFSFGFAAKRTPTHQTTGMSSVADSHSHAKAQKPAIPAFLRMFPVRIECRRAAAALGNETTTSIIVPKAEKAVGTIDAGHAGPLDLYKLLFQFDIEKINVTMKPNRDFKQYQLDAAQRIMREREAAPPPRKKFDFKLFRSIRRRWHSFVDVLKFHKSVNGSLRTASMRSGIAGSAVLQDQLPGQGQWHGLERYLDDRELNEHDEWKDVEYAKASTLADIDKLHMRFYFDMPGKVTEVITDDGSSDYDDDINGSKPPDYGMDFAVHGGVVTYGPWNDRQRINIQQVFVPASYVDAIPPKVLRPGETRNWTVFKILVTVEEDVVLRIPTRESSKDDKWQGRARNSNLAEAQGNEGGKRKGGHGKRRMPRRRKGKQGNPGADARPYAWLDVTVKPDSTVRYNMDMFSRPEGYRNTLSVDVKSTEITSSVNHGLLWRTGNVVLDASLPQNVTWNELRKWPFNIEINDMELFILRDHMFLIIDIVNDWSAGPPPDFYTFVPYIYNMRMLFRNFIIYLNVNDANIVNEPADLDRNDFLTLEGLLDANLDISMEEYRPVRNWIEFDVLATNMRMRMLSPSRSTFNTLMKDKVVADLPKLTLTGSFSGHLEERVGLTDLLRFDIVGSGLTLKAYGFLIRQLINVKENYFGDYMHFKTLEEFQSADEDLQVANVKTATIPKPTSINELDVVLCIIAEDVTVMVPTTYYSAEEFVSIELPLANLDLRILSYYLDMGLQLSPITFLSANTSAEKDESPVDSDSSTQLFVKHMNLDGHRAFGPPPDEPAYINQWDIDIGSITGEFSSAFIHDLSMAGQAFIFAFEDRENSLPLNSPSVFHDATFVQVRTDILRIWMHVGKDAMLLSTDPVEVVTNDWAGETFSQRVSVLAPKITFACVDGRSASRNRVPNAPSRSRKTPVRTYAFFQTGVAVNVVQRKLHFEEEKRKQQDYIHENDRRTGRAPFLQLPRSNGARPPDGQATFAPPAMPYPNLPLPLDKTGRGTRKPSSIKSVPSYATGQQLCAKSSSSSLSNSVRNGAIAVDPRLERLHREESDSRPASSQSLLGSSRASSEDSRTPQPGRIISDRKRAEFGLPRSTMAFSSSFAEPYFPLDMVEPDESNVPGFNYMSAADDAGSDTSSIQEAIEDPDIDHDAAQTSVLIKLLPGIRAYVEPRIVTTSTKLLRKVLPKHPEEVMDAFQYSVMGKVAAQQQGHHGTSLTLEIQIALPSARFRVSNPVPKDETEDRLDVNLRTVDALVRTRQMPSADGMNEVLAVHATADGFGASLGQCKNGAMINEAVKGNIDNVLVWVAVAAARSIHAAVGDTIVSVSAEQAEYVTDLILRVLPLASELKGKLDTTLEMNRKRLLQVIYTLTQNSHDIGDPQFLGRMIYILRAFPDHFRNQESWKVVSRFRHILGNLPPRVMDELKAKSKDATLEVSPDASARALENWAQWRNWDVPSVHRTLAFQALFGEEETQPVRAPEDKALTLTVKSDYLRVAIEADELSNEVVLEETSLGLDRKPPTAPTGLMLLDENTRTKTLIQMHTSSIAIGVNWSVFAIIELVLPLQSKLEQLAAPLSNTPQHHEPHHMEDTLLRHVFQVVGSTDNGSITVASINLRHVSRAEGLKVSVIGTTQAPEDIGYGPSVCAIVNFDAAITELHGREKLLWKTRLTSPSLYVDHLRPMPERKAEMPPSMTVAVGYKGLQITLLEQIPGFMQIVDAVILDEVSKVMKLVEKVNKITAEGTSAAPLPVQSTSSALKEVASSAGPNLQLKIHVALLAGELNLEVSLLQELKYQLQGTAASVRIAPSFSRAQSWGIDYDVGGQRHCFVNSSANERQELNILDVPPINGHVGVELAPDVTSLEVAISMERIDVDATAIQGIVSVMSQPEVQDIMTAVGARIEEIKDHVAAVMPQSTAPKPPPKADGGKQLAFDTRFALGGIRVAATTPRTGASSFAEAEFGIGSLHMLASNRSTLVDGQSLIPEVRAQIRDIGAKLRIYDNGKAMPCGNVNFGINVHFTSQLDDAGKLARELKVNSHGMVVEAYPDTAATAVDVINHLQDRIKSLDLTKEREYLRRFRDGRRQSVIKKISSKQVSSEDGEVAFSAVDLLSMTTTVELTDIRASWLVDKSYYAGAPGRLADLVLSLDRIELTTRGGQEARLTIEDTQLSLAKKNTELQKRSLNSAILPEVSFSVASWVVGKNRSFAFKAAGRPLEIYLESKFVFPLNAVQRSIESAIEKSKAGTAKWQSTPTMSGAPRTDLFDTKRLASLLIEADFAGAQFYLQGSGPRDHNLSTLAASSQQHGAQHGRYGQFAAEGAKMQTTLKAPGIAMKVEYNARTQGGQPTVNGEVRVDASSNSLLPNVVPLLLEVSHSVKEVMQSQSKSQSNSAPAKPQTVVETKPAQRFFEDESIVGADPAAFFGKTKVDLGLRICRQEFGLTCQPIARVDAKAQLDDFYITMNTIESEEHGHFFAVSAVVTKLNASVKHMYSREPTFSFDMESIELSVLNSKHLSGTSGISAILKINPTRTFINGKQLQDLLLFREIWLPPEIRASSPSAPPAPAPQPSSARPDEFFAQKYHSVAAAAAFPWNATISIIELAVDLDLGQSIGKSSFTIKNLWASQVKSSSWEQNLCVGMDEMAMNSTGRMSGFIRLNKLGVRTSIKWPQETVQHRKTPLIQASAGFQRLRAKAAFDYQAFAFGDIEGFDFMMYNVHQSHGGGKDRLVAVLDCEKAYVFCNSTSPAQAVGLFQAFDRLIQEKQAAYTQSLMDIEKHLRRESTIVPTRFGPQINNAPIAEGRTENAMGISLHTDVVLTMGAISFGVFPSTFFDSQILKLEANNIQARFAVGLEKNRIVSGLGMTLGQLQVALASVRRMTTVPKALDISVDDVVSSAVNAKGGTILRVPKVVASMQTWQAPDSYHVDYIFKSLFDGKIDVGWNLSRIDFIKNMWTAQSRSLASRLGKTLPESAVKITAGPANEGEHAKGGDKPANQEKITAEVNLPQSRYEYNALETPIIETPQLRDMGEATPPLEWIGLHRDRLPNVTHQIIIVGLLEIVKEVEDAYEKILGSS